MEQRLQFHLEFARGRNIVVWGTGKKSSEVIEVLSRKGIEILYFVSKEYDKLNSYCGKPVYSKERLDKNEVYVIDATSHYVEVKFELEELGFELKSDFYNWYDLILPYDTIHNGIPVGKCSYFPGYFSDFMGENARFNSIVSIGRFTSINGTAQVHADHNMKAISTGIFDSIIDKKHLIEIGLATSGDVWGRLEIGNDVWIGANAFINLSKVKSIGDGAIIGSGAVVVEDVPPYAVVVGVPAKVKKYRFTRKQIELLDRVKWWNWSNTELKENIDLIADPDKFFKKYAEKES